MNLKEMTALTERYAELERRLSLAETKLEWYEKECARLRGLLKEREWSLSLDECIYCLSCDVTASYERVDLKHADTCPAFFPDGRVKCTT